MLYQIRKSCVVYEHEIHFLCYTTCYSNSSPSSMNLFLFLLNNKLKEWFFVSRCFYKRFFFLTKKEMLDFKVNDPLKVYKSCKAGWLWWKVVDDWLMSLWIFWLHEKLIYSFDIKIYWPLLDHRTILKSCVEVIDVNSLLKKIESELNSMI